MGCAVWVGFALLSAEARAEPVEGKKESFDGGCVAGVQREKVEGVKTTSASSGDGPSEKARRVEPKGTTIPGSKEAMPKASEKNSSKTSGQASGKGEKPLRLPVRDGDVSRGLELPETENGKLRSFFSIEKLSRIGEFRVNLNGGFIEFFEEDGNLEFSIDLSDAVFEEDTRMLVAKKPVTVRTPAFELTGKGLKFNTQTRGGSLDGPVRMVIYSDSEDHE